MESYGRCVVMDLPFERGLAETIEALREEGIDLVGRLDVREYLARTLQHDFRQYVLLEAVAPRVTLDALCQDLGVGAILPITIVVFELPSGETAVVVSEPFGSLVSDQEWRRTAPTLAIIADRAAEQLARALGRLQHAARRGGSASAVAIGQVA